MKTRKEYQQSKNTILLVALYGFAILFQSCGTKAIESTKKEIPTKKGIPVGSIMHPDSGQYFWVFPESKDKLGTGGKLQIYMDAESHPHASASFAKYELGVGGALPEHRHDKTEEIAYFLSGEGIAVTYEDKKRIETPVKEGFVWCTAPGEYHSFKNTGNEPLKLIFAIIPNDKDGLLSFFKKVGATPGKEARVFSPEEFGKVAAQHDLILKPVKVK